MKVRKAVFPAAGLGTRFLPATKAQPKEMLPLVDKPTIQYVVEEAVASGLEEIILVTGRNKRAIEDHFDAAFELEYYLNDRGKMEELAQIKTISELASVSYVRQKEPLGLGHAILCARPLVGNEPFGVFLGDDIITSRVPCMRQLLDVYERHDGPVLAVMRMPREEIGRYGVIAARGLGANVYEVQDLVEKPAPQDAPSDLAIIGRYVLTPDLFPILQETVPESRGEIQLDREGREPMVLLDEIERVLKIACAPVTWPIGMGRELKGIYHLPEDRIYIYQAAEKGRAGTHATIDGLASTAAEEFLGDRARAFRDEVELVRGAAPQFDIAAYLAGKQTPVFFGSAINNFGVTELLSAFVRYAPGPLLRETTVRFVEPDEEKLTGFVFKIQANMDPGHRDRIAFMRICSGRYAKGMRLFHVRLGKEMRVNDALTFLAADRQHTDEAFAGDILGLHNHGTINIGDTFTEGESLMFTGIPNFAPEMFRRVVLRDPLRMKALQKGLDQLCEEGATQVFRPLRNNDLILGAVGQLQFEVVAFRLQDEYTVQATFDNVNVFTARWIYGKDAKKLEEFRVRAYDNLALDHSGALVYLAPTRVNLQLTLERWPDIEFRETREHLAAAA